MAVLEVLKSRLSRTKDKRKDYEKLIDTNAASNNQKQQYVDLKAREDELENIIDIFESFEEKED